MTTIAHASTAAASPPHADRAAVRGSIAAWRAYIAALGGTEPVNSTSADDVGPDEPWLDSFRLSAPRMKRLVRLAGTDALNALPYPIYRMITSTLKRMRGTRDTTRSPSFSADAAFVAAEGRAYSTDTAATPAVVCVTHDIDTAVCYDTWPELIERERAAGVRSASNVLTRGPYTLDQHWLAKLAGDGFELGLHGDSHDMAIGYRAVRKIERRIRWCLEDLGRPLRGYRAPAFAISEPLMRVLAANGFWYDSTAKVRMFYRTGKGICVPYRYPGIALWELPLALQDDALFRDAGLNEDDALEICRATLACCRSVGGLLVINVHPVGVRDRLGFYEALLELLRTTPHTHVVRPMDLVRNLRDRLASILNAAADTMAADGGAA